MAEAGGTKLPSIPQCIADRPLTKADVGFQPETSKELILEYSYDIEQGDDIRFELLKEKSPEGVYARFMVIRSDPNSYHVLTVSSFIPKSVCDVEIKEKKLKKDKGFYRVTLGKKSNADLANYFLPKRSSSSDEEKK